LLHIIAKGVIQLSVKKLLGPLYDAVFAYPDVCEIRLSLGNPVRVLQRGRTIKLSTVATQALLDDVLAVATDYSVYTAVAKMRAGYLPYRGGVRLGLAGTFATKEGQLHGLQRATGLVIRLPRAVEGCSDVLPLERVLHANVLVVAPPFGGKTTFLRDLARRLSAVGNVVVLDERGELWGDGTLGLGECMVVNAPKGAAYRGVVRALNPEFVVMDELSPDQDEEVLRGLAGCGVRVVATAHGNSLADKPYHSLFDVRVLLSAEPMAGQVVEVRYA